MVSRPLYLFIGEDSPSKDTGLKRLIQENLTPELEKFNLDILYARELELRELQERLLSLPVKARKRLVVIKGAEALKSEVKEFILKFARKPPEAVILILDMNRLDTHDNFARAFSRYAQVSRFRERLVLDTFALSRAVDSRRPQEALRILHNLLENGRKPELILGGLRYVYEKDGLSAPQNRRRLKHLLDCDINIKTGRLQPAFALERLIVRLCCYGKPSG